MLHCAGAPIHRDDDQQAEFNGVAYRGPTAVHSGPDQGAPVAQADLPLESGLRRTPPVDREVLKIALNNAALRDEEQGLLARSYHRLFEVLLRGAPAKGSNGEDYDALPFYRLHLELADELHKLAVRAQALDARWLQIADAREILLSGPLDDPDAAGRLRLHERFARCVDADARSRLDYIAAYKRARAKGRTDADIRLDPAPPLQFSRDIKMMARAMTCGRLAMRVLRGP